MRGLFVEIRTGRWREIGDWKVGELGSRKKKRREIAQNVYVIVLWN